MANVRLIRNEAVPKCGSFEVRFPDGRTSKYFYWDYLPSRRLRLELVDGATALEQPRVLLELSANGWAASKGDPSLATGQSREEVQQRG
jgi:hypothetical protein